MEREQRQDDEARIREVEQEATEEAAQIGGDAGSEEPDPERSPVEEAGGGEAEGFERAEGDLLEHSSHGDPAPDPGEEAGELEAERTDVEPGERTEDEHGEPDEPRPSDL